MRHAFLHYLGPCLLAAVAIAPLRAGAVVQRTFVSGQGSDANPCSIAAPCRSFAAAIAQTVSGGEVVVLDSAGYGPVTITSAVSITAPPGIYAGVSVSSGDGVVINAGASDRVVLRGLNIVAIPGVPVAAIRFLSGGALVVEGCNVTGMPSGIVFQPPATATLWVSNSFFSGRGLGRAIAVGTVSGFAYANIARTYMEQYQSGVYGSDRSRITVVETVSTRNFNNYELETSAGGISAEMTIARSVSSYSDNAGIRTSGSAIAIARVSDSVIIDENNNAVAAFDGSSVLTRSNNLGDGSASGPYFTGTLNPR
jgi:hypothetical protein